MERRVDAGGIRWLLDLIEEHRGPIEFDWRTRFGVPLTEVGHSMTLGEAARLVTQLAADLSSHTAAAIGGWSHPWSWEAAILADIYDLTLATNTRKQSSRNRYPRPWPSDAVTRRGDAGGRTPDEIRAELARMRGVVDGG